MSPDQIRMWVSPLDSQILHKGSRFSESMAGYSWFSLRRPKGESELKQHSLEVEDKGIIWVLES